jgi:hypothetical protein
MNGHLGCCAKSREMNTDVRTDGVLRRLAFRRKDKVLRSGERAIVDRQQLEWLQCVRDYSDGVRGFGGYAIAGPGLHPVDQRLRRLGYVVGISNCAFASVVTDNGRAALAAQYDADRPPVGGASRPRQAAAISMDSLGATNGRLPTSSPISSPTSSPTASPSASATNEPDDQ